MIAGTTKLAQRMFREAWVSMLWHAMAKTGNGYRKRSMRHTGRGDDKRKEPVRFGDGLRKMFAAKNRARRANGERMVA